jgi:hypothetical protein
MLSSRSKKRQIIYQQVVIQVYTETDYDLTSCHPGLNRDRLTPNKLSSRSKKRHIITQQVVIQTSIVTQQVVVQT